MVATIEGVTGESIDATDKAFHDWLITSFSWALRNARGDTHEPNTRPNMPAQPGKK